MGPLDLSGRSALVTGGNRGIGLALVRALAGAGAEVTFTARSPGKVEAALAALDGAGARGGRIRGEAADVADAARMGEVAARGFDLLVNNAGVIGPIAHLGEADGEAWAEAVRVNLLGAVGTIRAALPGLLARGGTVVNLSSGAAHKAMEGWSAYCASKAALAMVTRSLHLEYGGRGLRAFGFAPGVVDTGMQGAIRASGMNPVSRLPREALAPPEEPAWAIAWLATAEADPLAGRELDIRHEDFRRAAGLPPLPA